MVVTDRCSRFTTTIEKPQRGEKELHERVLTRRQRTAASLESFCGSASAQ